jgi:hypothetical protein
MRALRLTGTIALLSSLVVSAQTGPHEARAK